MTDSAELPVPLHALDPGLTPPAYAQPGDAGADLRTAVDVTLAPGERALVPSGLAVRHGLSVVNAPGTVDAGYRGEIKVPLINLDPTDPVVLRRGDRIAQLVIQPVVRARFEPVDALPGSERGAAGFGSTGGFGTENTPGRTS